MKALHASRPCAGISYATVEWLRSGSAFVHARRPVAVQEESSGCCSGGNACTMHIRAWMWGVKACVCSRKAELIAHWLWCRFLNLNLWWVRLVAFDSEARCMGGSGRILWGNAGFGSQVLLLWRLQGPWCAQGFHMSKQVDCLYVCLSICVCPCLSVCICPCLSVPVSVCQTISLLRNICTAFLFFFQLYPNKHKQQHTRIHVNAYTRNMNNVLGRELWKKERTRERER